MNCLIPTLIALLVFAAYNTAVLTKFGVPASLSDSFYLWNKTKKGLGFIFTLMMFTMAGCLMPGWLTLTETVSTWSHNLTVLPFIAAAAIAFVGAAPAFKDCQLENKVHVGGAVCAAVFSILWICIVCYHIAWIILPACLILVWIAAFATKTHKTGATYWWEMVAFASTFITIITQILL
jgi:hypothetical protein